MMQFARLLCRLSPLILLTWCTEQIMSQSLCVQSVNGNTFQCRESDCITSLSDSDVVWMRDGQVAESTEDEQIQGNRVEFDGSQPPRMEATWSCTDNRTGLTSPSKRRFVRAAVSTSARLATHPLTYSSGLEIGPLTKKYKHYMVTIKEGSLTLLSHEHRAGSTNSSRVTGFNHTITFDPSDFSIAVNMLLTQPLQLKFTFSLAAGDPITSTITIHPLDTTTSPDTTTLQHTTVPPDTTVPVPPDTTVLLNIARSSTVLPVMISVSVVMTLAVCIILVIIMIILVRKNKRRNRVCNNEEQAEESLPGVPASFTTVQLPVSSITILPVSQ